MEPDLLWHLQELLRRTRWLAEENLKAMSLLQSIDGRLAGLEARLEAVELTLAGLEARLTELGSQPSTRIDKIEYRFEQLKVDTLEGTLQIGLAQGVKGLIDDLSTPTGAVQDVKLKGNAAVSGNETIGEAADGGGATGEAAAGTSDGPSTTSTTGTSTANALPDQANGPSTGSAAPAVPEGAEPYLSIRHAVQRYMNHELLEDIDAAAFEAGVELPLEPGFRTALAEDLRAQIRERSLLYMKQLPTKEGPDDKLVRQIADRIRTDVQAGLKQYFAKEQQAPGDKGEAP